MRRMILAAALLAAPPVLAGPYAEYPAPVDYPFQRSTLTPRRIVIAPYDEPFRVRIYTTPPQQPFYNVPPYGVITPY